MKIQHVKQGLLWAMTMLVIAFMGWGYSLADADLTYQAVVLEIDETNNRLLTVYQGNLLQNPKPGEGIYFGGYSKKPYLWLQLSNETQGADGNAMDIKTIKPGNRIEITAQGMAAMSNPPILSLSPIKSLKVMDTSVALLDGAEVSNLMVTDFDTFEKFVWVSDAKVQHGQTLYVFKYAGEINHLKYGDTIRVQLWGPKAEINGMTVTTGAGIVISARMDREDEILRNYPEVVIQSIDMTNSLFVVTHPKAKDPNQAYMQFKFTKDTIISTYQDGTASAYAPGVKGLEALQVGDKVRVLSQGLDVKTTPFSSSAKQVDIHKDRRLSGDGSSFEGSGNWNGTIGDTSNLWEVASSPAYDPSGSSMSGGDASGDSSMSHGVWDMLTHANALTVMIGVMMLALLSIMMVMLHRFFKV